ncbi:MAG: glycosyltransferase [Abyssibacter sp.]|uniref:glycosyltransferase n=1 Tax=Abyssibacter sp. TaxID=2320200 RepID=UPI0032191984
MMAMNWHLPPWLSANEQRTPPIHQPGEPRVLQLSTRVIDPLAAYAILYEFEDVLSSSAPSTRVTPENRAALEANRRRYKLIRRLRASSALADRFSAGASMPVPDGEYDLAVATVSNAWNLHLTRAVRDWKSQIGFAACYIFEAWASELPDDYLLEMLEPFDHVFVGLSHAVEPLARRCGKPCSWLPLAADVLRFAPHHPMQARSIDVCNIGRRSEVTHAAFQALVRERGIFYYYDTAMTPRGSVGFTVNSPADHRNLYANLLSRSRYFVANRAKLTDPRVGHIHEIPARFYEGIAAGTVLIGEPPDTACFREQFDWPSAVISMPFDYDEPLSVLEEMEADDARRQATSRTNVRQAAQYHDWLHRIERIFEIAGLPPTAAMRARRERLALVTHAFT